MSGSELIYWDSCIFISLAKRESISAFSGIEYYAHQAKSGNVAILTSTITRVEVLQARLKDHERDFADLFRSEQVTAINVDSKVAEKASELRSRFWKEKGKKTIGSPDAIHLATALLYGASRFHTTDRNNRTNTLGLLKLAPDFTDLSLEICLPAVPADPTGQTRLDEILYRDE